MAARRTHYDVLGVAPDASSVEIAAAFRDQLAELKAKPAIAPEALDAMREAYQTLANPARREEYDRTIGAAQPRRAAPRAPQEPHAVESGSGWGGSLLKFGIPVAIVAISVWGWKAKNKPVPPPPAARIVEMRTIVPGPPPGAQDLVPRIEEAAPEPVAASSAAPAHLATARSAEDIFAAVSGSVALVVVGDAADRAISQGSAVVIGNGVAITNCHVVKGGSRIMLKVGTETRRATVAVSDEKYDLCRLDVPGLSASPVEVGTVADVRTGQRVFAIGAPQGLNLTISDGIVSSLRDTEDGRLIQTTAPVSPGSSGGGLFNADGRLIGIVTFQYRGQNLNFAVPADWIGAMSDRGAARVAAADPTIDEMVVGRWYCFGSISGRNGEYVYGSDGIINVNYTDGRPNITTRYQVAGRRIFYQMGNSAFSLEIESITSDRMVQLVGAGQRLACDRRH